MKLPRSKEDQDRWWTKKFKAKTVVLYIALEARRRHPHTVSLSEVRNVLIRGLKELSLALVFVEWRLANRGRYRGKSNEAKPQAPAE